MTHIADVDSLDVDRPLLTLEEGLVARLVARDEAAMQELVGLYGRDLHSLIGRLTAYSADVEDLLQETLITAWRTVGTYRHEAAFSTWLKTIAIRKCHNRNRGLRRFWRHLRGYSHQVVLDVADGVETNPRWVELQNAMCRLSDTDREILVLYYLEQMNSHALAQLFGTTPNAIDVRLHRARKRLQDILGRTKASS